MQVTLLNNTGKKLHINIYDYVQDISLYKLYKRNNSSIDFAVDEKKTLRINFDDLIYISDSKLYNVFKIMPKFMREFWDGITIKLNLNPSTNSDNNMSTALSATKLLPDTKLWYIFDDKVYNFAIVFIALVIVILTFVVIKCIKKLC